MSKLTITKEDALNIINFNEAFDVKLSDEDNKFLKKMSLVEGEYTQEQAEKLKVFICNMLVTSQAAALNDVLWDHPKAAAQEILDGLEEESE